MSDHLPECPLLEPCDDDIPEHGYCSMQRGAFCIHCHQWCICDRLRSCEQRVEKAERAKWSDLAHDNWQDGWEEGIQAAREAVAAMPGIEWVHAPSALAAIDGLRGES